MKLKNKLILGAILPLSLLLSGCGKTEIDMNKYLTIECDGYDTIGTASYEFDTEQMIKDNLEAFGLKPTSSEETQLKVLMQLENVLGGELDKTKGLKNGDKLKFCWDKDMEVSKLEEAFEIELSYSDKEVTLDDFAEVEMFDPFEGVTLSFTGTSPNGQAKFDRADASLVKGLNFEVEPKQGLKNGDKVTVTVKNGYSDDFDDYCAQYGKMPSVLTKEYTVEGLASYIAKLDELPKDALDKMDKHAQDCMNADVAKNWNEKDSLKGMKLIGNYLLTPKGEFFAAKNNILYFVYKMDVTNSKETFSYYYYSSYSNIMLLADGTCSFDLNTIQKPEGGWFGDEQFEHGDLNYTGYLDLDSLFNQKVTTQIDNYAYESSVKE